MADWPPTPDIAIVTVYGSSPDCDVVVNDEYASSRHARVVEAVDGRAWLEDLGSTNGTYWTASPFDRQRIYRSPIRPGSQFRVGRTMVSWPPVAKEASE